MTADWYLRLVGFELRDLPWRTKRGLLAEIRTHLAELPEGTDLVARLGPPKQYAAELRTAAGLARRRGPVAFLRARRPRNVIIVVVAFTVLGLAIGAVEWVDSYQPIAMGNTSYDPDEINSPAGDGVYVIFHEGKSFRYGTTIWNSGRYAVRVLGVPEKLGFPVSYRLLMSAPTTFAYGGIPGPYTRFRPFDLKPGEQRGIVFSGVYREPCRDRSGSGSTYWEAIPVRFRFLWETRTVWVPIPEGRLAFFFPKSAACAKAKR